MQSPHTPDLAELQRKLEKAARWMDEAESDGMYQAARQLHAWFESQIHELTKRAA